MSSVVITVLSILLIAAIGFISYQFYLGNIDFKLNDTSSAEKLVSNKPEVVAVRIQLSKILKGIQKGYCNDKHTMKMLEGMMVKFINTAYDKGACDEKTVELIKGNADIIESNINSGGIKIPFKRIKSLNKDDIRETMDAMIKLTLEVRTNLCKIASKLSDEERKVKFTELAEKLANVLCDGDWGTFATRGIISDNIASVGDTLLTYQ